MEAEKPTDEKALEAELVSAWVLLKDGRSVWYRTTKERVSDLITIQHWEDGYWLDLMGPGVDIIARVRVDEVVSIGWGRWEWQQGKLLDSGTSRVLAEGGDWQPPQSVAKAT